MTTIKIDIDKKGKKVLSYFAFRLDYVKKYFPEYFKEFSISTFSTKKGYHAYLFLNVKLSDYEIILLQSVLMSDWLRELRNYRRVKSGDKVWNLLFKTKIKNGHIQHERLLKRGLKL